MIHQRILNGKVNTDINAKFIIHNPFLYSLSRYTYTVLFSPHEVAEQVVDYDTQHVYSRGIRGKIFNLRVLTSNFQLVR